MQDDARYLHQNSFRLRSSDDGFIWSDDYFGTLIIFFFSVLVSYEHDRVCARGLVNFRHNK